MMDVDVFCELLRARLTLAQHQRRYGDLAGAGPAYRCDPLFLQAADLSDAVVDCDRGVVGPSVVSEAALETAALAFWVFHTTAGVGSGSRPVADGGLEGME